MNRTLIKELKENETSKISGFVTKLRDTKYMVFLILKDRTGEIQVSFEKEGHEAIIEEVLKRTDDDYIYNLINTKEFDNKLIWAFYFFCFIPERFVNCGFTFACPEYTIKKEVLK